MLTVIHNQAMTQDGEESYTNNWEETIAAFCNDQLIIDNNN